MLAKRPIKVVIPPCGVLVAESAHDVQFEMTFEAHEFYEIYYLLKGAAAYFESGGETPLLLSEGTAYAISPGVRHRIEDRSQATVLLLCFSASFIREVGSRGALWDRLVARENRVLCPDRIWRGHLERSLRLIMAELEGEHAGADVLVQAEALKVLVGLARLPDESAGLSAEDRVRQVVAMMEREYFEEWDLDSAAARGGLSRRRFSAIFRELTGETFLERLTSIRLDRAAEMLRVGQGSIAGTAFSVGFNDVSHFYRVFRKRHGMAPGSWVKKGSGTG